MILFSELSLTFIFQYGGVTVHVQNTAGGIYINLNSYEPGVAPALLMNHTTNLIQCQEKGVKSLIYLEPMWSLLFAWSRPAGGLEFIWHLNNGKPVAINLNEVGLFLF